ncbi:MAG: RHS repeat domain-containing protein [Barnesiella sp.]
MILYLFPLLLYAQRNYSDEPLHRQYANVLPPSPEAASLCEYAETPVSYFYGLPQIDIPLYTVQEGSFSLPVSISYHGGIKVNELASRVGLGWALNAGGVISRTVCGLPDETITSKEEAPNESDTDYRLRGFFHLSKFDKESIRYNMTKNPNYDPSTFEYVPPTEDNLKDSSYYKSSHYRLMKQLRLMGNFEGGFMDSAQDMYSFNFMGYSGAFMLNQVSGFPGNLHARYEVKVQTDSPIEFVGVHFPDSFSIRDRKGVMYYFQEKEFSYHPYKCYDPLSGEPGGVADIYNDTIPYVSSWYLTRIEIPGEGSISLSYKNNNRLCVYSGGFQMRHDAEVLPGRPTFFSTANYTVIAPKMLSSVSNGKVEVLFINDGTPRRDINNDISKLDYIYVRTKDGNYIRKYKFCYSYFSKGLYDDHTTGCALKLDKIEKLSLSDNASVLYRGFTYDGDGFLPWTDYGQDHWGYPNGKDNLFLVPEFVEFPGRGGADRNSDREIPKKGSLTAVSYPTGGRVEYEWEPNTYSYVGGSRLTINDTSDREEIVYKDTICGLTGRGKKEITIDIPYPQSIKLYLNKPIGDWVNFGYLDGLFRDHIRSGCDVFPRLIARYLDQPDIEASRSVIYLDEISTRTLSEPGGTIVYRQYLEKAGTYKISLEYEDQIPVWQLKDKFDNPGIGTSMYGNIPIEYFHYKEPQAPPGNAEALGGGLRIKEIRSLFSGDTVIKRYSYNYFNEPLHSSGALPERPNYTARKYVRYAYDAWHTPPPTPFKLHTNYSSGFYRTPVGAPRVEYGYVSEQYIYPHSDPAKESGAPHVDRYYTTTVDNVRYQDLDEMGYSLQAPPSSRIRTSMAHYRGNLKRISYCNAESFYSIKDVYYDYQIVEDTLEYYFCGGLFVLADFALPNNAAGFSYNSDYGITKFRIVPYNKRLKKMQEEYSNYSVTSEYTYFSGFHTYGMEGDLPLSVTRETSTGGKEIVYYTYLKDFHNGFITDKVTSEIRVIDGYIVDAKRNRYDLLGRLTSSASSSCLGKPAGGYPLGKTLELTSGLENLFDVPGPSYIYDAGGHILDIEYCFVPVASFLWGYGGSHPVAEFRGMTSADVDNILRNAGLTRRDFLENSSRTEEYLGRLRAALPAGSDVTTLTYRWLVGVVSETDGRGVTTYYNYDDYGRLKEIRDYNRHLIRKYTYNLKSR